MGLTRVGIIGLVDEATGYQRERAANALAEIRDAGDAIGGGRKAGC